jgi:hypothetical protein
VNQETRRAGRTSRCPRLFGALDAIVKDIKNWALHILHAFGGRHRALQESYCRSSYGRLNGQCSVSSSRRPGRW